MATLKEVEGVLEGFREQGATDDQNVLFNITGLNLTLEPLRAAPENVSEPAVVTEAPVEAAAEANAEAPSEAQE